MRYGTTVVRFPGGVAGRVPCLLSESGRFALHRAISHDEDGGLKLHDARTWTVTVCASGIAVRLHVTLREALAAMPALEDLRCPCWGSETFRTPVDLCDVCRTRVRELLEKTVKDDDQEETE